VIGPLKEGRRDREAEGSCRLEIDGELEGRWLFDRETTRLRAVEGAGVNARADAVVPLAVPLNAVLARNSLDLAARSRFPTMTEDRSNVDAGALLAYYSDPRIECSRVNG